MSESVASTLPGDMSASDASDEDAPMVLKMYLRLYTLLQSRMLHRTEQ